MAMTPRRIRALNASWCQRSPRADLGHAVDASFDCRAGAGPVGVDASVELMEVVTEGSSRRGGEGVWLGEADAVCASTAHTTARPRTPRLIASWIVPRLTDAGGLLVIPWTVLSPLRHGGDDRGHRSTGEDGDQRLPVDLAQLAHGSEEDGQHEREHSRSRRQPAHQAPLGER